MPVIQDSLEQVELCRPVLAEPGTAQRAQAIAETMRTLIEEQRQIPQSAEDRTCLGIAETILDFLEAALHSRYSSDVH